MVMKRSPACAVALVLLWSLLASGCESERAAPDFAGVWTVNMRYAEGSCPDLTGGTQAAVWTVNTDSAGQYTVAVQGDEAMPKLSGRVDGDAVVIIGLNTGLFSPTTRWRLSGGGDTVRGRAIQTRIAKDAFEIVGKRGDVAKVDGMCAVIWEVEAKRQGGS